MNIRNGVLVLVAGMVFCVIPAESHAATSAGSKTRQRQPRAPTAAAIVQKAAGLAREGEAGADERQALARRVAETYLSDAQAVRRLTAAQWNSLCKSLGDAADLDDWAPRIWSAFADAPAESAKLAVYRPTMGSQALRAILPKMDLPQMARFSALARKADRDADANRQIAAEALLQAARNVEVVAGLKTLEFSPVAAELAHLDAGAAAGTCLTWFRQSAWKDQPPTGVASIVRLLAPAVKEDKLKIAQEMQEAFGDKPLTLREAADLAESWTIATRDHVPAVPWAMRAYQEALGTEEARAKATLTTLVTVCEAMEYSLKHLRGNSYPEAAEVLVRLIREDKIKEDNWRYTILPAFLLCTPETIATVRGELFDSRGNPRLAVAKMLCWAYCRQYDESMNQWRQYVQGQLGREGLPADVWAVWSITAMYCDRVEFIRPPKIGRPWMEQLLDSEASAALKGQGLLDLMEYYIHVFEHDKGLALIEDGFAELQEQTGQNLQARLTAARKEILHYKAVYLQAEVEDRQSRVREMGRLAANAKTDEDKEFFLRWQKEFQKELDEKLAQQQAMRDSAQSAAQPPQPEDDWDWADTSHQEEGE